METSNLLLHMDRFEPDELIEPELAERDTAAGFLDAGPGKSGV